MSRNDITGDKLVSKASNENFDKGFQQIDWSKKMDQPITREPPGGVGLVTTWRLTRAYRQLIELLLGKSNGKS